MTFLVGLAVVQGGQASKKEVWPRQRRWKKYLVKVANSMPKYEFLRIGRKLTRDAGGSGGSMDLFAPPQVDCTPNNFVNMLETWNKGPVLFLLFWIFLKRRVGSECFVVSGSRAKRERNYSEPSSFPI